MGLVMGSTEALEVLVTDKVGGRFGDTVWGGIDFETEVDPMGDPVGADFDDLGEGLDPEEEEGIDTVLEREAEELKAKLAAAYGLPAASTALARRNSVTRVEAVPKFKGSLEPKAPAPTLPADLISKGYRLRRDDTALWFERGRGRNVIKGQREALDDIAAVTYGAYADLEARGGPAPTRSKKATEATEEAGPAAEEATPAEAATFRQPSPDALALAEAGDPDPAEEEGELSADELAAVAIVATEAAEEEEERALPAKVYRAGYRLNYNAAAGDLPWAWQFGEGKEKQFGPWVATAAEAIRGAVDDHWARTGDSGTPAEATPPELATPAEEATAAEEAAAAPAADAEIRQPGIYRVAIGKLRLEWEAQSRVAVSDDAIAAYELDFAAYGGWGQFPPVMAVYDGEHYWVYDGFQRITAYRHWAPNNAGDLIPVDIRPGGYRDAILYSAGVNAQHGLRRSRADIQNAVGKLLRDPDWRQWSDAEIARRAAVDAKTVGNIRRKLIASEEIPASTTRRTADGHTVTVKPAAKPAAAATVESEIWAEAMIQEPAYTRLIEAGFVLEKQRTEFGAKTRWAWPQPDGDAYRGDWVVGETKAAQMALEWFNHHYPLPPAEAPATVVYTGEPSGLPVAMTIAGYSIEKRQTAAGERWIWLWQHSESRADWYMGPLELDQAAAIEGAKADYSTRFGEGPAEEEEATEEATEEEATAPELATAAEEAPAAVRPTYAAPALPDGATVADRLAAATEIHALFAAALKSLPVYERLTGRYTMTPQIRRSLEPAMEALNSLLGALG